MKPNYAALLLALAPLGGCFILTNDREPDRVIVTEPTNPASTLTVRWTVSGSTNATECQKAHSPTIAIRVFDVGGREIGAYEAACGSFATSIPLDAGTYSASALMLGESRQPRSAEVAIERFTLSGGDEIITDVDFTPDALLNPT